MTAGELFSTISNLFPVIIVQLVRSRFVLWRWSNGFGYEISVHAPYWPVIREGEGRSRFFVNACEITLKVVRKFELTGKNRNYQNFITLDTYTYHIIYYTIKCILFYYNYIILLGVLFGMLYYIIIFILLYNNYIILYFIIVL